MIDVSFTDDTADEPSQTGADAARHGRVARAGRRGVPRITRVRVRGRAIRPYLDSAQTTRVRALAHIVQTDLALGVDVTRLEADHLAMVAERGVGAAEPRCDLRAIEERAHALGIAGDDLVERAERSFEGLVR